MKVVKATEAAALIQSGWMVGSAGFLGTGHPDLISTALEKRFLDTGEPRDLSLVFCAGQGDRTATPGRGAGRFGHVGMTKRVIGGHFNSAPKLLKLVLDNEVEAYNLPQGVIAHLYRAIAGGRPGVVTTVGLHTFVDPRHEGARMNPRTTEQLVELITIKGREYLFYPIFPIHCVLLRGTTADENGNITTEHEVAHVDHLAMAQAAHNSGGIVIVQVKRLTKAGTMNPNLVRVPGILVDYVVVAEDPEDHWMTYGERFNPAYTGEVREPEHAFTPPPLDIRKVIQRRAFMELSKLEKPIVNVGVGMPSGVGDVAREEGKTDFTFTVEAGPIGGTPASGLSFGGATNPEALVDQAAQFDFFDGGGLDITILGMAELDGQGNVNASSFGNKRGIGGFINITQRTKHIVFMGTFTGGGLQVAIGDGRLQIVQEGRFKKVLQQVSQLSFNGPYAAERGADVLYVTERAVFKMRDNHLTLVEIAPGVDLQRDILNQIETDIVVAPDLKTMDPRIFFDKPMMR